MGMTWGARWIGAAAASMLLSTAASAVEITWWTPNWGEERARELASRFEADNPDIKLNLEITIAKGLQNRVLVALRSGNPPDLIQTSNQWTIPFAATGKLLALDDFAAEAGVDLEDLVPATVDVVTYEGSMYGMPYRAQTHGLIYNKGMFREAGLDPERPPETWAEMIEFGKKLTNADENRYGIGVSGGGEMGNLVTRMLPFIWMNGGRAISEDLKTAMINEPEAVEAVEFYTSPLTTYKIAPPSTLQNDGAALRRLFDTGNIAMYISGQYDLPAIREEAPDIEIGVGLLPHPEGKETAGVLSGWGFVVPLDSDKHEATLKFLAFMMKPENQAFLTDTFPAARSAMSLPRFQDPLLDAFKEALNYSRPVPATPAWAQANQIIFDTTQEVLLGVATPQEAMDSAAEQIQELLDRYHN